MKAALRLPEVDEMKSWRDALVGAVAVWMLAATPGQAAAAKWNAKPAAVHVPIRERFVRGGLRLVGGVIVLAGGLNAATERTVWPVVEHRAASIHQQTSFVTNTWAVISGAVVFGSAGIRKR
jgi:hypothetical protein